MTKRQDPITKLMIIWLIKSVAGKDRDYFTSTSAISLSWVSKQAGKESNGHNQKI